MRFVRTMLVGAFAVIAAGADAQQPPAPPAGTTPRAGADSTVRPRRAAMAARRAGMHRGAMGARRPGMRAGPRAMRPGRARAMQGRRMTGPGAPAASLFAGIRLAEAERAAIRSAREKHLTATRTLRERMAPDVRAAADARRRRDTTAARTAWERTRDERTELDAAVTTLRTDLRNALTPEHRARFDENVKRLEQRAFLAGIGGGLHPAGRRARQ